MANLNALQGVLAVMDVLDAAQFCPGHQRRIFCQRRDPITYFSDGEFLARYRLSKESFNALLSEIRHYLPSSTNRRGLRISPSLQLLLALRYLATGNFMLTLADSADVSQASMSRCIGRVVHAIAQVAPRYIRFPTPAEESAVMQGFSSIAGMPECIGCIDGTLIPIRCPSREQAQLYRVDKGIYAYNVMAVCDARLSVTSLVVNCPGSAHDSNVFSESQLCQTLTAGQYSGFLVGDSAYSCQPYLLTPYSNPKAPHEEKFNEVHTRTHNCVKRVFGILKRRFGVLVTPLRTKLDIRSDIIVATVVLHNIAVQYNLPLEEFLDGVVEDSQFPEPNHQANTVAGEARRTEIAAKLR